MQFSKRRSAKWSVNGTILLLSVHIVFYSFVCYLLINWFSSFLQFEYQSLFIQGDIHPCQAAHTRPVYHNSLQIGFLQELRGIQAVCQPSAHTQTDILQSLCPVYDHLRLFHDLVNQIEGSFFLIFSLNFPLLEFSLLLRVIPLYGSLINSILGSIDLVIRKLCTDLTVYTLFCALIYLQRFRNPFCYSISALLPAPFPPPATPPSVDILQSF